MNKNLKSNKIKIIIKDTQCGFKLFTNSSAKLIFTIMHLERWAFDVELFIIAKHFKIPFNEYSVNWREIDESKLNVLTDSIQMARDFIMVRILFLAGLWRYDDTYTIGK